MNGAMSDDEYAKKVLSMPGHLAAIPVNGRPPIRMALNDNMRSVIMPLAVMVVEIRATLAAAEEQLSQACRMSAGIIGIEIHEDQGFRFEKGDDGKPAAILWDPMP